MIEQGKIIGASGLVLLWNQRRGHKLHAENQAAHKGQYEIAARANAQAAQLLECVRELEDLMKEKDL